MEDIVLNHDLKKLQKYYQQTIIKTKETLNELDGRIYDQKHLLKECIREVFLINSAEKLYSTYIYYSLAWIKLIQKKKKKSINAYI